MGVAVQNIGLTEQKAHLVTLTQAVCLSGDLRTEDKLFWIETNVNLRQHPEKSTAYGEGQVTNKNNRA